MVWGSIWLDARGRARRSRLIIMESDPDARKRSYTARSYINTLQQGLLPHYRVGRLFMHDNASIHTARIVTTWLAEKGVTAIEWPPYSPDLNPIEHMWRALKKRLYKYHSYLLSMGNTEEAREALCTALKTEWRRIPESFVRQLLLSMPRRLRAVRDAKGYYTKY